MIEKTNGKGCVMSYSGWRRVRRLPVRAVKDCSQGAKTFHTVAHTDRTAA